MTMPHHLTCPHCETALSVADDVLAQSVTCPRCLARIPHPGATGATGGTIRAIDVDAEARRDSRGTGCGVIALVALVCLGSAFALSLGISALGKAGRYGDNLLTIWFVVGGFGGLLVLGLTTVYMTRALSRRLGEADEPSPGKRGVVQAVAVIVALLAGIVAGLVLVGLTCGAILGGASVGGF